ncbi:MAG: hypothetical protein JWP35_3304 [Caulobacter sp.]|nr:hypothetical protein [Caulobacter sp.]
MRIALLASTAAALMLTAGVASARQADAPPAPSGTIQDEVNNTTQPARDANGNLPGATVTTTTRTEPAPMAEAPLPPPSSAMPATAGGTDVSATEPSVTTTLVTNGPVPDTAENRAKYGGPQSHAGKRTAARGN